MMPAMRVGFCGLGLMGSLMAAQLARAGHELAVWNRTRSKAEAFVAEHGGRVADSPAGAAEGADAVITMLVDGEQVATALEGIDEPLCIDMSTIGPAAARDLGRRRRFLDAPVSGSTPGARDGTLTIMVGGAADDVEAAMPLFEAMGRLIVHVGPVGQGQAIKVITNAVAAANAAALAQALVVGAAVEVDLDKLVDLLGDTAAASTMVALKGRPMLEHDWTPLFRLDQMLKDVRLCLDGAASAGIDFPAAEAAREVLERGVDRGLGNADFAALLEVVEARTGRRL
ncbi:2-hydroxy-3-oxopropionate reductase [Capillimicrobium parvum]|uniref:2-hydroxy-3-oxopropionate reductase n=2 Tax=Capillimicrobium parvum TaxID=2884022 RepID=A0A9E6Y149_9ACTN|nr:2-hydroxy-3-oxopropionate reductase [Capillimicrobium parvum]